MDDIILCEAVSFVNNFINYANNDILEFISIPLHLSSIYFLIFYCHPVLFFIYSGYCIYCASFYLP